MALIGAVRRFPVVVILGLTGAGKSKLAIDMAIRFNGEIISTDSMQIYRGLDIATNKVSAAERKLCVHHMLDIINPQTTGYTIVQFRDTALPLIGDIISRERIPFLVGGTNYYIESLLWNFLIETEAKSATTNSSNKRPSSVNTDTIRKLPDNFTPEGTHKRLKIDPTLCNDNPCPDSAKHSTRLWLENKTTSELYQLLWEVDIDRAKKLQPNDRRKILRSLEVFYRDGYKMSDLLKEQHKETGSDAVSGPLRFKHICVIWIQCDQEELDARIDRRVDEMIEKGLIQELTQFHHDYNEARLKENKEADYSQGIFQSIGFKEFHEYLLLSDEQRQTDHGKALLKKGIEDMKIATRQYARKQKKWIISRFLKRRGGSVPPVYAVNGTNKNKWEEDVLAPACDILTHYIEGKDPPYKPLAVEDSDFKAAYNKCDLCNVVTLTVRDWEIHIKGKRHRNSVRRQRKLEKEKEKNKT